MNIKDILAQSKKEYIAKIDNTFLVYPIPEDKLHAISSEETEGYFKRFPNEIMACLKNMPNVTKYSTHMSSEMIGYFYLKEEKTVEKEVTGLAPNFPDSVSFQAMWPRKNQDVPSWYLGEVVESFHIIYDGAIFLAFGESTSVGNSAYAWEFGKEAMKIIKSCFEKSNLWKVATIGPIMLHPAVYLVFVDPRIEITLPTSRLEDNNLYVFLPYQNDSYCETMGQHFFDSVAYEIKNHYGNELLRIGILLTEDEFREKFETLSSLHHNLLKISSWNPVTIKNRYSCTRRLRDGIREAYELYIGLMDMQAAINEARTRYLSDLSKHRFLKPLADYFEDELSDVGKTDLSPILQGLRFLEEETRMVTTTRSNIEAALVGALIASAIYAIALALSS